MLGSTHGAFTVPVNHRDGHRLWVAATFNHADDPDSGRPIMVGTLRDVTAEHYVVQRQTALAALNQQLAQADTLDDALRGAGRGAASGVGSATRSGGDVRRYRRNPVRRN